MIKFFLENISQSLDFTCVWAKHENMSFVLVFQYVPLSQELLIDSFLDFLDHFFFLWRQVLDIDRIHSAWNFEGLFVEVLLEQWDLHWGWCDDDFEIFPFGKQVFHQSQNDIDTDGSFMCFIDDKTRVLIQSRRLNQLIQNQSVQFEDDLSFGMLGFTWWCHIIDKVSSFLLQFFCDSLGQTSCGYFSGLRDQHWQRFGILKEFVVLTQYLW